MKKEKAKTHFQHNFPNLSEEQEAKLRAISEQMAQLMAERWSNNESETQEIPVNNPEWRAKMEALSQQQSELFAQFPQYEPKYGYVDRTGKQVFPCEFEGAGKFVDGLAPVIHHGQPGFINRAGEMVIRLPEGAYPTPFSDGLALIQLRQGQENLCGFIDRIGQFVIGPRNMHANPFNDGLALVTLDPQKPAGIARMMRQLEKARSQTAYINKQGEIVFSPDEKRMLGGRSDDEMRYSEGLIPMRRRNKVGYVDLTGKFVIQPQFLNVGAFSEGLARVEIRKGKYESRLAFIDHTGEIVIDTDINTDADFERNSTNFSEGWAGFSEGLNPNVLKAGETWGFLDRTGRVVLETPYFYAGSFREGLATVYDSETNKRGSIDKTGALIIPLEYDSVGEFSEGLAVVGVAVEVELEAKPTYDEPPQEGEQVKVRVVKDFAVSFYGGPVAKKRRKKKRQ
jgi:hypothetical protein